VDWTAAGDVEEPLALLLTQRTAKLYLLLDQIRSFATVPPLLPAFKIALGMPETNGDSFQRPAFASRIQRERDGRS
jgi:hypothetical protein